MNMANKLTVSRIMVVPIFIMGLAFDGVFWKLLALFSFVFACVTDWLDGKYARENNSVSDFGKFMDPLADKILICSAFISFVAIEDLGIPAWTVIIIISREFLITGFRTLAASKGIVLASRTSGKFKTTSQMIAIIIILIILFINSFSEVIYSISFIESLPFYMMLVVAALTLYSGFRLISTNRNLLSTKDM